MAVLTAQGNLELSLDETGLKARLRFLPSSEGNEISVESLVKFLQENGINGSIKRDSLKRAMEIFARADEPTGEIEVAEGTPPVEALPPVYEWTELPVPEELAWETEQAVGKAGSPEIFVSRVEKVKTTRTVLKKAKLPFLPPKEVVEELVERQERRERVYVNPETAAVGWVQAGTIVAKITPGRPGKPGSDVFGKPLLPVSADFNFYCGRGIEERKNELAALETGFLRRGENWAEIIPYALHQWEVTLSEDHASAYLDFNPGHKESAPPAAQEVLAAVVGLGYPEEKLLSGGDIQALIAGSLTSGVPLRKAGLSVDEDSHFALQVSDDKLKAFLTIQKHRGSGKPLVLKDVGAAISGAGFKGLDKEAVRTAIMQFYRSPASELKNHLLLTGTAPVAGEDDSFALKVTYMHEEDALRICERGKTLRESGELTLDSWEEFPPEAISRMAMVKSDQLIGEIVTGKSGEDGFDVFGARLKAPEGRTAALKTFENLRIEKNLIVAEIDGVLEEGGKDGCTLLRLHPHKSASVQVRIAEDRMSAALSVSAPSGTGFTVDGEALREAAAKAGVSAGLDEEALIRLTERAARGEEIVDEEIARGQPPKDAGKVEISFKIEFASGRGVTIGDDGRADFRRQDRLTSVKEGQLIAEVYMPPGESEPGWDVTGKSISSRELKQIPLEAGPHVEARDEGEGITRFYALKSGELVREKNRLEVKNIHAVAGDVDMKTGNIKFSGSVQVKGSVQAGFVVFSGGDIQIGGTVDGALISSEGSIYIVNGVKGAEKAVLRAKKDIVAGFIEQAQVMAVGDIRVKKSALRSTMRCNGRLLLEGEKGSLIGGILKTRQGAEVQNLGHPNGIQTQIFFGQDYLIADRIQVEEREITRVRENIIKLDTVLRRLEAADDKAGLARARQEKLKFLKHIEKLSLRLFTLREKYEEHYPSQIVVRGNLYPGVILESHGRYYEVDAPGKGVRLVFNPEVGKIQLHSIDEGKEKS
jgi:uncharacterized protein